ncbi:MAG: C10 family peptidase [Prevotella sp.]|nr:C10 family peptidase [Prevotella sp.]
MRNNRLILMLAFAVVALVATATPRSKQQMKEAAVRAINEQRAAKRRAPIVAGELQTLKSTAAYEVLGYEGGGFAVMAKDDVAPEVLGVSAKRFNEENTNFQWWLKAISQVVESAANNGVTLTPIAPDPSKFPTAVPPMLTTEWDQLEPYNRLCPTHSTGGRCYTGCVATAMAQVLNYFKTPEHGIGQRTIYYGSQAVTANFEEDYYDWDNMLDKYTYGYSDTEANAVAVLMRDCGVAANMEYGGSTEGGSGAYSQDAADGLRTYFGFADAQCIERDNYYGTNYYTDAEWMDMVFRALSEDGPIYYGGADTWQGGHAFVLHGYNAEGKVYVNWGWSGDDDGYYDISLLNPSYYQFSVGQDMIIGVKGAPRDLTDEVVALTEAGTLSSQMTDEMIGTVGSLKLTGDINSSDLRQIRRLAGIDEHGERTVGYLQTLDLSEARIVSGGDPFLIDGSNELTTADNELPQRAFYGCRYLKSIKLPNGLKTWGEGALALCSMLSDVDPGTPAEDADFVIADNIVWNKDKTEIIAALPSVSGVLDVAKGTKTLHDYALAGCARLTKVVVPSSIETIGREALRNCSGLSEIRMVSREAPTLSGADVFAGISYYTCKLYVPSGSKTKYAQKAQWSNFKGGDYDNIVEYGSSVKVRNTIRYYGEENPELTFTVQGDPIEGTPVLTCEATKDSPAGRYPITIEAGTITDEMVTLIDGYLVVQKVKATATVANATREVGQPDPEFTLTFEGLVNGDEVPVWVEEPVFTCEANADSPAGDYPITVTAKAESYDLTFVAGTLTILPASTGINKVTVSENKKDTPYYRLNGQRSNMVPSQKGVYIHNGRKMIVR